MNPYLKNLLIGAAASAALLTSQVLASKVSAAGPSLGFPAGKPYYGAPNRSGSQWGMRSRSMYRSTTPVIVRSERSSDAVAQAPSERRSYSYEPAQENVSGSIDCHETVVTNESPATAQQPTETRRSFSYEPSMSEPSAAPRSYYAPRMRSSRQSATPLYLRSKDERNNYRNQ
jgi:hypothetical protein